MYKIETHLHTNHVSKCGKLDAETLVEKYHEAGYRGIIVTDHYNRTTFDFLGIDLHDPNADKVGAFLDGYRRLAAAAEKYDIRVFKGAELRFDESDNDYLLYGFRDELLADPEKVFAMGIAQFASIARAQGAMIVQAHPYRAKCTPAIACYLDGVEVFNGNPRHNSFNDRAAEYAQQFGLIGTSGSDCHQFPDIAVGGILTDYLPSDSMGMMRMIRARRFENIVSG